MNDECSPELRDLIRGTLMAHAIGDALGFGAEGLSKAEVAAEFEGELRDFAQIKGKGLRALRRAGMWTDDTSQMLCILESLVSKKQLDRKDIARHFYRWLVDDGFGCGALMYQVVGSPDYLIDPEGTASGEWVMSGKQRAPNGAVMRTSVLGVWNFENLDQVTDDAIRVSRLTHADPRCAASCVAVSVAIACQLQGMRDVEEVINTAALHVKEIEPGSLDIIQNAVESDLESLDLDCGMTEGEPNRVGYTYVTLAAGFWALAHAASIEEGIVAVINEGGDADTNAAVAGALLGSRFGFKTLPERWIEEISDAKYLVSEWDDLIRARSLRSAAV